jgi:hypothetical protein
MEVFDIALEVSEPASGHVEARCKDSKQQDNSSRPPSALQGSRKGRTGSFLRAYPTEHAPRMKRSYWMEPIGARSRKAHFFLFFIAKNCRWYRSVLRIQKNQESFC